MLYIHKLDNARNSLVVPFLFDFLDNLSGQRKRPVRLNIELAQTTEKKVDMVTSDPWDEWFRLGEEISRNWQSNQTVLEILSEVRR